jgi:serine/threonine protein kinase
LSGGYRPTISKVKESWLNEVTMMKTLNQCQDKLQIVCSPLLYDAWMCTTNHKTHFYIVMEKYQGNLNDFIRYHKGEMSKVVAIQAMEKLNAYLLLIHMYCNICINDIKFDNILYKQTGPISYQFVFADFGLSYVGTKESCIQNDRQMFKRNIEHFRAYLEQ